MYTILANVVVAIHLVVIIFMIGGLLLPKKWKRTRIFHSYFCIMVVLLQIIYGFKCPLVFLEEYLWQLGNPEYEITLTPFTERIFMRLFGFSISSNIVFIIIMLLAVLGIAQLLTMRTMKKGYD